MKNLLLYCWLSTIVLSCPTLFSQVFWTESFGTGCNQGQLATAYPSANGFWTVTSTGTNQADANIWFISATENGHLAGECGDPCGNNQTLHLGSKELFGGLIPADLGAAYNASSGTYTTNKRAESPTINCTGKSVITLTFTYIENGQGAIDDCTLWYFNGSSWAQIANTAKTTLCSGQGVWTTFSMLLPSSADNNPNVKIGFNWTNNADNIGTDPSFAVDDIQLSTPIPTPVELLSFTAELRNSEVLLDWVTLSEKNNDYFKVQRSSDGFNWSNLTKIKCEQNSCSKKVYSFVDLTPIIGVSYYRLTQTDLDGRTKVISDEVSLINQYEIGFFIFPNPVNTNELTLTMNSEIQRVVNITIRNYEGSTLYTQSIKQLNDDNQYQMRLPETLANGIYFFEIESSNYTTTKKIVLNR